MPRRRTLAVNHCLNRAAEAERLAVLAADDPDVKALYEQLARAWRRLSRDAEFTSKLNVLLNSPIRAEPISVLAH